MKALIVKTPGDQAVMEMATVPSPALGPGEVRIAVRASGVNRADLLQKRGLYPPPSGASDILGLEVAGDVMQVGAGVKGFREGDRVMALLPGGGYAEEACVDEGLVLPIDPRLDYAQGAAIPEAFLTAHHNLVTLGGLFPESRILIHAGASGVGTAGIQIARGVAKEIWVTVGTPAKAHAVEQLGANAILYREKDFAEVIRREGWGKSVDLILDPVGARYLERNLSLLAIGGTLVLIAVMGGKECTIDLSLVLRHRLRIIGSTLRNLPLAVKRAVVERFRREQLAGFATRELVPVVDKTYPATQVEAAHARMAENQNVGKLILTWS